MQRRAGASHMLQREVGDQQWPGCVCVALVGSHKMRKSDSILADKNAIIYKIVYFRNDNICTHFWELNLLWTSKGDDLGISVECSVKTSA